MSRSTRSQFYHYTLRTVGIANGSACTDKLYLYPVPPEDALTLESIFTHLIIRFDSAIATADRVVESIGIANQRPLFYDDEPQIHKKIVLNQASDGNRRVDIKLDLTDLLVDLKENVAWTPRIGADYDDGDQTFIYLKLPDSLHNTLNVGTIELWKADLLYTTREIR